MGTWHIGIELNGTEMARDSFQVTGSGISSTAGAAHVTQGSTYVPNGRTTPIDFGTVSPSSPPPQLSFTIANLGSSFLAPMNLLLPKGFSLVGAFPTYINNGGSATFTLQMDTGTPGVNAGMVQFNSNDPSAPTYRFAVKGTISGGSPGALHGQVFHDFNGDALADGVDTGLPGWTVSLLNPVNNGVSATTTSGFNGFYAFFNLPSGNFRVRVTPPAGWTQTTLDPADAAVGSIDVLVSPVGYSGASSLPTVTAPSDQMTMEGSQATFNMGSFADTNSNSGPWTINIGWGDNSATTTFMAQSQGTISSQLHTYTEEGAYMVSLVVTDNLGASASADFQVSVSDPGPTAVSTVGVFVGQPGVPINNQIVGHFSDPAGPEPTTNYVSLILWGDNTVTVGTISLVNTPPAGPTFAVTGNHTYAQAGVYLVLTLILDESGGVTLDVALGVIANSGSGGSSTILPGKITNLSQADFIVEKSVLAATGLMLTNVLNPFAAEETLRPMMDLPNRQAAVSSLTTEVSGSYHPVDATAIAMLPSVLPSQIIFLDSAFCFPEPKQYSTAILEMIPWWAETASVGEPAIRSWSQRNSQQIIIEPEWPAEPGEMQVLYRRMPGYAVTE